MRISDGNSDVCLPIYRSAEQADHAGAVDVDDGIDLHAHAIEVGRILDVGGDIVPRKGRAIGRGDLVPARIALEHVGIVLLEHVRADRGDDGVADFLAARPDVLEVYRLAVDAGDE